MKISRKEYFHQLKALLEAEKFEDKFQFETSAEAASVLEKESDGKCWYPVYISSSRKEIEYMLCFKRKGTFEEKGIFQIGNLVRIYNGKIYENENYAINGKVTKVTEEEMRVSVESQAYRLYTSKNSWLNKDDLVIEQNYSRKGYDKMKKALDKLQTNPDATARKLTEILIGNALPEKGEASVDLKEWKQSGLLHKLNDSQKEAISDILHTADVSMILGPPGTGKTTTIVHAIKLIVDAGLGNEKILVTAQSNTAVDLLAIKLHELGIDVLRLGNAEKIHKDAQELTLSSKMQNHPDYILWNSINNALQSRFSRIRAEHNKSVPFKAFDVIEALELKNKEDIRARNKLFKTMTKAVYSNAKVIACTLEGAISQELKKHYKAKFKYAFIDEAGQALEPLCWYPVLEAQKIVMIGDHYQLPPVVKSNEIYDGGLRKSLFEKVMDNGNIAYRLLNVQYRMHEQIMNFSNEYFYKKRLIAAKENQFHTLLPSHIQHRLNTPVEFIDTRFCNFMEEKTRAVSSGSTLNRGEKGLLMMHLEQLMEELYAHQHQINLPRVSIGIITPYRQQLYLLEEAVEESEAARKFMGSVSVNTVDGFQGQEQDIIYISLVRSNRTKKIGFLSEYRRFNVAVTRARKKVVIIGDSLTLASDDFFKKLIQYTKREKVYFDAKDIFEMSQLSPLPS